MATTGQTINDRLNAVRYALAGQGLARTVCKATTEEVLGPKKKHIDYLLACTDEPNVSIPQLANLLIDRSQHTSWAVVFKSLITIHNLLNYGNERFTQYLATSNHSFELDDFMDRTTPQGYGMSTFVRRYAKYINNKISSYRVLAIDLCKVKPGKDNGLRTMNMDNLCKTLPIVHSQFDTLLDFGVEAKDLNNGIIMAAFKLLYKDLNRIFAAYQEAIINLVERYFKLSRKKTREALNMYKKYLDRMDKVSNFFKIVEQAGLDKSEMPDTSKLVSLLSVLEEHMAQLEAKKRGANVTSPDPEDHGDESVTPTKEVQQETANKSNGSKDHLEDANDDRKKATPEPPTVPESSTAGEPPKKAPPPPARPSPVKLPKGPQPESKPTPSGASAHESEKKAPPVRPSKPPSRPPPPSASPSAVQPPTVSEKPSNIEPAPSPDVEPTEGPSTSSSPPPAPKCLPDDQETSQVTQPNPDQTDESNNLDANGANPAKDMNNGTSNGGEQLGDGTASSGHADTDAPACSSNVDEVTIQAPDDQSAGTNHVTVNNANSHDNGVHDDDVEPPPPPPPIED